jgi:hypothetical protein
MIDLAVIAGVPHLHDLSAYGSIDMALTHLVLANDTYADYFLARSRAGIGVLLDNSAYELETDTGLGLPADAVLAAADRIAAHVVICQDVLYDGAATVVTTKTFVAEAAGIGYELMAVPQGRTRAEWLDCYRQLVQIPGVSMIGLSKLSVPRSFDGPVAESRLDCVKTLVQTGVPLPLHLLGGDRSLPWELAEHLRQGHDSAVVSSDSSFAFWYPATGTPVDAVTGRAEREAPGKPDLTSTTLSPESVALARTHIRTLRAAAGLNTDDSYHHEPEAA